MKKDNTTWQAGWHFENTYETLPDLFFSHVNLTPVRMPQLVKLNEDLGKRLGLDENYLQSEEGISVLAGNQVPEGTIPLAQAYAGHQFGYFTKLGDGRALLIGEQITPSGERLDIQLKGSGRTPYSRRGDGRATLGPMLREYLISEAMYGLGIPTTRSLAVVTTGESVMREKEEPGAILTRVAKSHLRVGTFQYAASWGSQTELQALADYALKRHFQVPDTIENKYLYLLQEVIKRQATTIAKWQLVGFVHGVMNTDNMTISGETIDYGPCAFMDAYDLKTVFSSIDREGRYAFGNQPRIGAWNLARLAEALLPLLDPDEDEAVKVAEAAITQFGTQYQEEWLKGMGAKLGISNLGPKDQVLIGDLLKIMAEYKVDYTNMFVALTTGDLGEEDFYKSQAFLEWYALWQARLEEQDRSQEDCKQLMRQHNPYIIPRNYLVEEALEEAVQGDYSKMNRLLQVLRDPYAYLEKQRPYTTLPKPSECPYRTFCGT